ncbi:PadR family transcriptional regulator [Arthrobacter sp. zg-Y820]|uniref:PadR family transcriptional regulator n=1 Tax=unclassified Arthrobacter TaxID=235627 RepID=UPI001E4AF424|nr:MULTISPECIES: PadR family transcriptional regulator [unclassified Arthrobacter]MCC9195629.1 PadR family transcriptional regulator [Arthrobacter sp. zg-Y820]MDK1278488.1 PadR family transcriptional regulator [Arthrobacter sp. zg.Y820]WIB09076.1 PadR family transcriptional regulator [Arthrobacter sp. zg-Y820]
MQNTSWPSDWMRATLGLSVLKALDGGATYGYAIAAELEEQGFGTVKGGTLYPLLTRFEAAGWVTTQWRAGDGGPGRKYFSLTAPGRRELAEQRELWARFAATVDGYLNQPGHHTRIPEGGTDGNP